MNSHFRQLIFNKCQNNGGKGTIFSTNGRKVTGYSQTKKKQINKMYTPYLLPHIKINLKWTKNMNVKVQNIKLSEETGINLHNHGLGNSFLDMTPKT